MKLTLSLLILSLAVASSAAQGIKLGTVQNEYDRFKDKTSVSLTLELSKSEQIYLMIVLESPGKEMPRVGKEIAISLLKLKGWPYDGADTLYLIIDDARSQFEATKIRGRSQGRIAFIPLTKFEEIIKAKTVEGKLGVFEFKLTPEDLKALADLRSQIADAP